MNDNLKNTALKLISKKEMSSGELQEKLLRKFPQEASHINEIIEAFQQDNWINDERYCEYFIEYQMLTTKAGPFHIIQKLKLKGISESIATQKIMEIFPTEKQIELAIQLAKKKLKSLTLSKKEQTDYERQQKTIQYLVGKGYTFDVAQQAVKEF